MATENRNRLSSPLFFLPVLSAFICVYLWLPQTPAYAQDQAPQEIVLNLAEGGVIICPAKDGIVVATIDGHTEAGSPPPTVVSVTPLRAAVLLGAVEWVQPESSDKPIRLDSELARLAAPALNHTGRPDYSNAASDIETLGVAVLERIRELAEQLHSKINIGEDEPLIRLVLVGYIPDYGPEAWTIDYRVKQDALGNDIWRTRVLRPTYNQLYPPEKGQPHTLIEVRYPPANRSKDAPELLDLLRQNDSRLAMIRAANQNQAKSLAFIVSGEGQKSLESADVDFLRAALPAVTAPGTKLTMAVVDFDKGFHWVMEPSKAERPPVDATKPSEPDAPTLRRKSTN